MMNNPPALPYIIWKDASVNLLNLANQVATIAYTDINILADTSALAKMAILSLYLDLNSTTLNAVSQLRVRKNGTTPDVPPSLLLQALSGSAYLKAFAFVIVALDAGQVFEYNFERGANVTANIQIDLLGYTE